MRPERWRSVPGVKHALHWEMPSFTRAIRTRVEGRAALRSTRGNRLESPFTEQEGPVFYSHHFAHRDTLSRAHSWLTQLGFHPQRIQDHATWIRIVMGGRAEQA